MSDDVAASGELIRLEGLRIRWQGFRLDVDELGVREGEFVAILGKSGCGKSSLLSVLGLLVLPEDRPGGTEDGDGWVGIRCTKLRFPAHGTGTSVLEDGRRCAVDPEQIRREHLGFSLQGGELIPSMTARENVQLPLELGGRDRALAAAEAERVLSELGLTQENQNSVSSELSGGQRQRGVFARAIAHEPRVVLLDEPTSALDELTARSALNLLDRHARRSGQVVVMVTHDRDLAYEYATRVIEMRARYPVFDGMIRSVLQRLGCGAAVVERGPEELEETEYIGLIPKQDEPDPEELAADLARAVGRVLAAPHVVGVDEDAVLREARAVAAEVRQPRSEWEIEGRIYKIVAGRREVAPKAEGAATVAESRGSPSGEFFVRLGCRDAIGPALERVRERFGDPDEAGGAKAAAQRRSLQLGFVWQLIGNAAVITAISVLLIVLMGMQQGLVHRFRVDMLKSPTARQLVLTPLGEDGVRESDIPRLLAEFAELELVLPAIGGLNASVRCGDREAEGVTLVPTVATDPLLTVVYPGRDFSALSMGTAVVTTVLAEKLGLATGGTITVETTRRESLNADRVVPARAELRVLETVESENDNLFVHVDLANRILDFKNGIAVRELGWPPYARPVTPKYDGYLVFTTKPLTGTEIEYFEQRSLEIAKLEPEHAAAAVLDLLKIPFRDRVGVYRAWTPAAGDDLERRSILPKDLEAALTDSDSVVLPWNEPIRVRLDGTEVRLVGLVGRSRWLKRYLPDPGLIPGMGAPELTVRLPSAPPRDRTASLEVEGGTGRLQMNVAAGLPPGPISGESTVFGHGNLVAHLHQWCRGEADFDEHSRTFVPVYRGRTYYRLRALVHDIYQVPVAHRRLTARFNVASDQGHVREMANYVSRLDLLVQVLQVVSFVIAFLATWQVFMEIVVRKQAVIGMLRIMGMPFGGIVVMLLVRAVLVAAIAVTLCVVLSFVGAWCINGWKEQSLCRLQFTMFLLVGTGALLCCLLGTFVPLLWSRRRDPLKSIRLAAEQR